MAQVDDSDVNEWWGDFKATFGKKYASAQAENEAKAAFKANMQAVARVNKDPSLSYYATGNRSAL